MGHSSTQRPTEVVAAFLDVFEAMDVEAALAFLADGAEYTNVPIGTVHGHAGSARSSNRPSPRSRSASS